jgi:hypothetical protein
LKKKGLGDDPVSPRVSQEKDNQSSDDDDDQLGDVNLDEIDDDDLDNDDFAIETAKEIADIYKDIGIDEDMYSSDVSNTIILICSFYLKKL